MKWFALLIALCMCTAILCIPMSEINREIVYKSGDIVQLKSGGPLMTVARDTRRGHGVFVTWMDYLGQPQNTFYDESQLNSIKE